MEEIAEGFVRIIGTVFRFLIFNFLFNIILFNLGRFSLLILTLGRYPKAKDLDRDLNKIGLFGIFILVLVWSAIFVNNVYLSNNIAS